MEVVVAEEEAVMVEEEAVGVAEVVATEAVEGTCVYLGLRA
jgi:hypothetical protein